MTSLSKKVTWRGARRFAEAWLHKEPVAPATGTPKLVSELLSWQRMRRACVCAGAILSVILATSVPSEAHAFGGYRLPWQAGQTFRVAQGWGGRPSHYEQPQYYAYDFAMPEGTPVLASNDGVVSFVRGDVNPNFFCNSWSCANTTNH
jgi:murein DD-endopeptidase MepM/ murein hydrolase activator NlpD